MFFYAKCCTIKAMEKKEQNFRRNYYTSDDSGKVAIAAMLAPLLVSFLFALLMGAIANALEIDPKADLSDFLWYSIPMTFLAPACFAFIFFLYNKIAKISNGAVNVKPNIGWKNALICIAVGVVSLFGMMYFTGCIDKVLSLTGYKLAEGLGLPLDNFGWFVLNLLVFATLPAIFEELIFRGMILNGLRKSCSEFGAIAMSALLFALTHGNLEQLIYPFIMGLVLGWIAVRTGSTFASMIVHLVNNSLVVLLAFCKANIVSTTIFWWEILLAFVLLALTGVIIYLIDRFYFKHQNQRENVIAERGKMSVFVYMAIAVGIVLLISSTILNFTSK